MPAALPPLPPLVEAVIETPRWGVVKRRADGGVDFVSPVPCPYNYGCIPGIRGGDGDPLDAVVLGPRLRRGATVRLPVVLVVDFVDGGAVDLKVVLSAAPPTPAELEGIARFFRLYARAKGLLARVRGTHRRGATAFLGLHAPPG